MKWKWDIRGLCRSCCWPRRHCSSCLWSRGWLSSCHWPKGSVVLIPAPVLISSSSSCYWPKGVSHFGPSSGFCTFCASFHHRHIGAFSSRSSPWSCSCIQVWECWGHSLGGDFCHEFTCTCYSPCDHYIFHSSREHELHTPYTNDYNPKIKVRCVLSCTHSNTHTIETLKALSQLIHFVKHCRLSLLFPHVSNLVIQRLISHVYPCLTFAFTQLWIYLWLPVCALPCFFLFFTPWISCGNLDIMYPTHGQHSNSFFLSLIYIGLLVCLVLSCIYSFFFLFLSFCFVC